MEARLMTDLWTWEVIAFFFISALLAWAAYKFEIWVFYRKQNRAIARSESLLAELDE
jgi:hypothetical protein